MEGVKQGRAYSRYAAETPTSPPFTGPVRKWKKQWVPVTANSSNRTPPLLLCRWVPLPDDAHPPPARRFRYTPVAALIDRSKQTAVGSEDSVIVRDQPNDEQTIRNESDSVLEKPAAEDIPGEEAEEWNEDDDDADSEKSEGSPFAKKRKVSLTGEANMHIRVQ
ncbi:Unknown protein [Striga hermonthica]|uniref:Uncharacterized protein n=1 Tax=Striga hermonthica TaxID=68872 RepID=A0A9N7RIQ5_STRHE|nr:Unknown protein [Striga hermonthica]